VGGSISDLMNRRTLIALSAFQHVSFPAPGNILAQRVCISKWTPQFKKPAYLPVREWPPSSLRTYLTYCRSYSMLRHLSIYARHTLLSSEKQPRPQTDGSSSLLFPSATISSYSARSSGVGLRARDRDGDAGSERVRAQLSLRAGPDARDDAHPDGNRASHIRSPACVGNVHQRVGFCSEPLAGSRCCWILDLPIHVLTTSLVTTHCSERTWTGDSLAC